MLQLGLERIVRRRSDYLSTTAEMLTSRVVEDLSYVDAAADELSARCLDIINDAVQILN